MYARRCHKGPLSLQTIAATNGCRTPELIVIMKRWASYWGFGTDRLLPSLSAIIVISLPFAMGGSLSSVTLVFVEWCLVYRLTILETVVLVISMLLPNAICRSALRPLVVAGCSGFLLVRPQQASRATRMRTREMRIYLKILQTWGIDEHPGEEKVFEEWLLNRSTGGCEGNPFVLIEQ